jgi:toxin YoeB
VRLMFVDEGWEDYSFRAEQDRAILKRLNLLIRETMRDPFQGIGKPEPLRHEYKGWWSRRIDGEHRLVYRVFGKGADQTLEIVACRFHYWK